MRHNRVASALLAIGLCAGALSGCSTAIQSGEAETGVQASSTPVGTATSFTDSLSCMDDMLLREQYGAAIPISSAGVIDATGKVAVGGRDMLIHAIALMSRRSEAFHYIDFDPQIAEFGKPAPPPNGLFVRGTISELNNSVVDKGEGAGAGTHSIKLGLDDQRMANVLAVDMSIENIAKHEVIPSTSTSNTLTMVRRDKSFNFDGKIGEAGLSFTYTDDTAEGAARGARTLIELTAIEMVGKYFRLPYWQCLGVATADPRAGRLANDYYLDLKPADRVAFDVKGLRKSGYYHGPDVTTWTGELRAAAAQYQQAHGAVPTGLENFDLFLALLKDPSAGDGFAALKLKPEDAVAPDADQRASTIPFVHATIDGAEQPGTMAYYAGLPVVFEADLSAAGYLVCFYQDAKNAVFRVYPNPSQPAALISRGGHITIPSERDVFRIRPTEPNSKEGFGCFASAEPILPALPGDLGSVFLAPLPVANIDAIDQLLTNRLGPKLSRNIFTYDIGSSGPETPHH